MQEKFQVSNPLVRTSGQVFDKQATIELALGLPGVSFRYTLDGTPPGPSSHLYDGPITIRNSCTLKAIAIAEGWLPSDVETRDFVQAKYRATDVVMQTEIDKRYPGEGAKSLIDREETDTNFHSGHWLGFEATDLTATIDLGKTVEVSNVIVSCLSATGSWIFRPTRISAAVSNDGKKFRDAGVSDLPAQTAHDPTRIEFPRVSFTPVQARFVKVVVHNLNTVPAWHPGAGGKSWLFVDEILVS